MADVTSPGAHQHHRLPPSIAASDLPRKLSRTSMSVSPNSSGFPTPARRRENAGCEQRRSGTWLTVKGMRRRMGVNDRHHVRPRL